MDPDATASDLMALADGLNLQWLIDPSIGPTQGLEAAIDRLFV
ncbi:hypothetical protein PSCLAVI8L_320012 [Pseudoclavibacter sp. 8L]|nr:hypothetical protein PSCLAVI8L_320012 [Pseudoclavibacter sp. 8L]